MYHLLPYCCIIAKPQLIHTYNSVVRNYLKDPKTPPEAISKVAPLPVSCKMRLIMFVLPFF